MSEYTIAAYNIQWMNNMFTGNAIKADEVERADSIAAVIQRIHPHVLAISEGANDPAEHQAFIDGNLNGEYQAVQGASRGAQNLVFYVRAPFELVSVDEDSDFYEPWTTDVDNDGVNERIHWERRPLEAVFRVGANAGDPQVRFILVHSKSKGVFDLVDLAGYQNRALGARKKLVAQATKLRERLDTYVGAPDSIATIVLGDMNDGPGLDPQEKLLGRSFVETAMGSVFAPEAVFHNAVASVAEGSRWTAQFPDPIVRNPRNFRHRVWIDHILMSPNMMPAGSTLRMVRGSGAIDENDAVGRRASDHRAVHCLITDD